VQELIDRVREVRKNRDRRRATAAIETLRRHADMGEKENLIPYIIDAVKAELTREEIIGTVREAWGLPGDPFEMRKLSGSMLAA
jgi:methylmalonyl-CoA mutase N-terminal domain/subunit